MAKSLIDSILDGVFDEEWIGRRGEKLTERELKLVRLFGRKGKILRNLYVPKADGGTSEIDVVYITAKGIFVIESKNYSGWIFGDSSQFKWTVCYKGGAKERFYNPVKQNQGHIKHLRTLLGDDIPLFSIIAFSERCELKKVTVNEPGVYVIKRDRLYATVRGIWDTTSDALTEEQFELLHEKLSRLTNASKAKRRAHIESIEAQFSVGKRNVPIAEYVTVSEIQQPQITTKDITLDKTAACGGLEETAVKATPPFCPKCGAPMVLRTAKRGQRAGKQFYGCSNYPSCKGIVNIG